jgi:DMSO/TMAO reductase YedYZ heme-binding membrane subunit
MVGGAGMKMNIRWLVQAFAFIGSIFFFIRIWDKSKQLFESHSVSDFLILGVYGILFFVCLSIMAVTSYLKQKYNGTLKNPIPFFEKLLSKLSRV